eukprot:GHVN01104447.1.p1 GENE.GHVN01104447.1~~GHVN01104447.1.p1  ORF type:complete len:654 (-),score=39.46 GHVN01104447.1:898-2859(-)
MSSSTCIPLPQHLKTFSGVKRHYGEAVELETLEESPWLADAILTAKFLDNVVQPKVKRLQREVGAGDKAAVVLYPRGVVQSATHFYMHPWRFADKPTLRTSFFDADTVPQAVESQLLQGQVGPGSIFIDGNEPNDAKQHPQQCSSGHSPISTPEAHAGREKALDDFASVAAHQLESLFAAGAVLVPVAPRKEKAAKGISKFRFCRGTHPLNPPYGHLADLCINPEGFGVVEDPTTEVVETPSQVENGDEVPHRPNRWRVFRKRGMGMDKGDDLGEDLHRIRIRSYNIEGIKHHRPQDETHNQLDGTHNHIRAMGSPPSPFAMAGEEPPHQQKAKPVIGLPPEEQPHPQRTRALNKPCKTHKGEPPDEGSWDYNMPYYVPPMCTCNPQIRGQIKRRTSEDEASTMRVCAHCEALRFIPFSFVEVSFTRTNDTHKRLVVDVPIPEGICAFWHPPRVTCVFATRSQAEEAHLWLALTVKGFTDGSRIYDVCCEQFYPYHLPPKNGTDASGFEGLHYPREQHTFTLHGSEAAPSPPMSGFGGPQSGLHDAQPRNDDHQTRLMERVPPEGWTRIQQFSYDEFPCCIRLRDNAIAVAESTETLGQLIGKARGSPGDHEIHKAWSSFLAGQVPKREPVLIVENPCSKLGPTVLAVEHPTS